MQLVYKLFLILLAMPAVFALTFDIDAYMKKKETGFRLSATGHYLNIVSRTTLNNAQKSLSPQTWKQVNSILKMKAVYVFGLMAIILYALFYILEQIFFKRKESADDYDRLAFLRDNPKKTKGYEYKYKGKR